MPLLTECHTKKFTTCVICTNWTVTEGQCYAKQNELYLGVDPTGNRQYNMTTQLKIPQNQTAEHTELNPGSTASTNIQTQQQQWADSLVTKHSHEQTDTALAHTSTLHTTSPGKPRNKTAETSTVCLKKKHPRHFRLQLEKALSDFHNVWHTCYRESKQSVDAIVSHHT